MNNVTPTLSTTLNSSRDYIRVASACPQVHVANVKNNLEQIAALYDSAVDDDVDLLVFPELSLTGYTIGDLVHSPTLRASALDALIWLARHSSNKQTALIVGLPVSIGNALYNSAAIISNGKIRGIVPKINLPTYKEFYEKRWYQSWASENTELIIDGYPVPFGPEQLFDLDGVVIGIEICEDLWVPEPPHIKLVKNGAHIIANPSASPEIVGKAQYRRNLVSMASASQIAGYIYAGADQSESTMDIVMGGHSMIAENGSITAERKPFDVQTKVIASTLDITHLRYDRELTSSFPNERSIIHTPLELVRNFHIPEHVDAHPFLPKGSTEQQAQTLDDILAIQAAGLAERVQKSHVSCMVIGFSGGLDSTLAGLVAHKATQMLGWDCSSIHAITMPAIASSDRTQSNAKRLATELGFTFHEYPINNAASSMLRSYEHTKNEDTAFENTHARTRTSLLFNYANTTNGLVVGTGDLSEIALGWCTYNGDHMSHYNPNASIPKTLIRRLVHRASESLSPDAQSIIADIIDTPISPELTGKGTISQKTEDLIGPYELHDFFEYHFVRYMDSADKILELACIAFKDSYTKATIRKWLNLYMKRFFTNQWKRSVMPDGAKVGSVSHSPRGDWRMPSDAGDAYTAFSVSNSK